MTETRLVGAWHSPSLAEITHTPASQRFRTFLSPLAIHQAPSSVLLLFLVYTPLYKHMDMFPFRVPQKKGENHLVNLIGSPPGLTELSSTTGRPHITPWLYRLRSPSSRGTENNPVVTSDRRLCAVQGEQPGGVLSPPCRGTQCSTEV